MARLVPTLLATLALAATPAAHAAPGNAEVDVEVEQSDPVMVEISRIRAAIQAEDWGESPTFASYALNLVSRRHGSSLSLEQIADLIIESGRMFEGGNAALHMLDDLGTSPEELEFRKRMIPLLHWQDYESAGTVLGVTKPGGWMEGYLRNVLPTDTLRLLGLQAWIERLGVDNVFFSSEEYKKAAIAKCKANPELVALIETIPVREIIEPSTPEEPFDIGTFDVDNLPVMGE